MDCKLRYKKLKQMSTLMYAWMAEYVFRNISSLMTDSQFASGHL